jgi:predicted O-linked N-acetylglucosamine transferase (SPINDLY family)
LACEHFRGGRSVPAVEALGRAVAIDPAHHQSLQLLGTIAYGAGNMLAARDFFTRAVDIESQSARYWSCLGATCLALRQSAKAEQHHRRAQSLSPHDPFVLSNFGVALASFGRHEEAVVVLERARRADPDDAEILCNLGAALCACGRAAEASAACRESLRLAPDLARAHVNLGNALKEQGNVDEAIESYRRAVRFDARLPQAHRNLGAALLLRGSTREASAAFQQALRLDPADPQTHAQLAEALLASNRSAEALAHARSAAGLVQGDAIVLNTLGAALRAVGNLSDAEATFREAQRKKPGWSVPAYNRALTLQAAGRLAEARLGFRAAMAADPTDAVAHGTYAGSLFYDPQADEATLLREHRCWADRHARPREIPLPHENDRDPERPLRVGYVSPDFRNHAVAFFLKPILTHHDRRGVRCYCYAEIVNPDARTSELRSLADEWRETVGRSDLELAALIRSDRIDLLVDLAGHLDGGRLRTFALKPAPVQISYLGYPGTTGLPELDYRLTDETADPPGADADYSETLVRLPGPFCCYAPPAPFAIAADPPSRRTGVVTFGSTHKLEKINDRVVDLWAAVLRDLPGSRLLLARDVLSGDVALHWRELFARRGIGDDRIVIATPRPIDMNHLHVYDQIDVMLDTFPWSGHTTACEALWMGVPTVTLRGERYTGRMVASLLTTVGLPDLVAAGADSYRDIAIRLAADEDRRAEMRASLRERLQTSTLCDGRTFTAGLEAAYRCMWRQWCLKQNGRRTPQAGHGQDRRCAISLPD